MSFKSSERVLFTVNTPECICDVLLRFDWSGCVAAGEGGADQPSDPEGDVGEHQEEGRCAAVGPLAQLPVSGAPRDGRVC